MTPSRLRECLDLIGWSQRELADRLAIHETRTRRWAAGRYPVPPAVGDWLERLVAFHLRNPAPRVGPESPPGRLHRDA